MLNDLDLKTIESDIGHDGEVLFTGWGVGSLHLLAGPEKRQTSRAHDATGYTAE